MKKKKVTAKTHVAQLPIAELEQLHVYVKKKKTKKILKGRPGIGKHTGTNP